MLPTRVGFLLVALAIVLLPWLVWRVGAVRRVAPLAVVQIVGGVLLGPTALGWMMPGLHKAVFTPSVLGLLDGAANLGVLLYVFVTGLHLDLGLLRSDARRLGMVAAGSVAAPFVLGLLAGWWMLGVVPGAMGALGNPVSFVVAVAICTAVTALPVLAAILREMGTIGSRLGQAGLAIAALNDASLWLMLAVLLSLSAGGADWAVAVKLAVAMLWFAVLFGVIRPWLLRQRDMPAMAVLVIGVSLALLSASISEELGVGYLIGAFAAGVVMPPGFRTVLLDRLEAVTATVLLPFFFMSTGLKAMIDPATGTFLLPFGMAVAATILGKLLGSLPARRLGFDWRQTFAMGAMLQTKGLMEVVVLAQLTDAGLISGRIFSAMVAMAVVCTVITAPLLRRLGVVSGAPVGVEAGSAAAV
jgi:Kef-type K+ transport system membrane component KefB